MCFLLGHIFHTNNIDDDEFYLDNCLRCGKPFYPEEE